MMMEVLCRVLIKSNARPAASYAKQLQQLQQQQLSSQLAVSASGQSRRRWRLQPTQKKKTQKGAQLKEQPYENSEKKMGKNGRQQWQRQRERGTQQLEAAARLRRRRRRRHRQRQPLSIVANCRRFRLPSLLQFICNCALSLSLSLAYSLTDPV